MAEHKKLRVLCFHGIRTNSKVMMNQAKGLRAALGDKAEFIFMDAPHPAAGPTDETVLRHHAQDAPFFEWWYENHEKIPKIPENENWSWHLDKFDDTIAFMDAKMQELGPIDVVVGFSQGATLLTVLSAWAAAHNKKWWKLCMCFGGVSVQAMNCRALFETPDRRRICVPFPSIHVIGKTDPLYKDGMNLVEQYDPYPVMNLASPVKREVFYHDGGHKFPTPAKYPELYEQLACLMLEHCHGKEGVQITSKL
ncbi:hypothetical protein Poli38472_009082 [Pythium oligandrum]|uniref:Serine hydrolase domain-containing protein n=1 Tax=Pythium oligandrum TaxID=41045 RepID=A0A8K1CKG9_PYTOL|nr:hypothetical protein Poli38472_009082 [Pythium oligandrum]|eukprot:TMW64915.1 hypothetical protein Poli38472_009082 [Pythium oligandrum]